MGPSRAAAQATDDAPQGGELTPQPPGVALAQAELERLEADDRRLTRSLRIYGVGFALSIAAVSGGLAVYAQNCGAIGGCGANAVRRARAGAIVSLVGAADVLATFIGMMTVANRRRRQRRRLNELRVLPVARLGDDLGGGLSLSLAW